MASKGEGQGNMCTVTSGHKKLKSINQPAEPLGGLGSWGMGCGQVDIVGR